MKKAIILFSGVSSSLIRFVSAHTGESNGISDTHRMMGGFSNFWGMGFFGGLFLILIVVVLIFLIIWLAKQIGDKK